MLAANEVVDEKHVFFGLHTYMSARLMWTDVSVFKLVIWLGQHMSVVWLKIVYGYSCSSIIDEVNRTVFFFTKHI